MYVHDSVLEYDPHDRKSGGEYLNVLYDLTQPEVDPSTLGGIGLAGFNVAGHSTAVREGYDELSSFDLTRLQHSGALPPWL